MRKAFLLFLLLISSVGCTTRYQTSQQFPFHDDGTAKPKIAVVPAFDHSKSSLGWDLSKEFTDSITEKLIQTGHFYLTSDFVMLTSERVSSLGINPFCEDLSWLREMHSTSEFLIFTEIISHNIKPKESLFFPLSIIRSSELNLAIRIKVVDLRPNEPQVILQEIFEDRYTIAWKMGHGTDEKGSFKHSAFQISPMGTAHNQMIKKITSQINHYILFVKSRS